jgi:hypothetical protein
MPRSRPARLEDGSQAPFRRFRRSCALVVAAAALALPGSAAAATVDARPADAFVDSIGINTHTSYTDTPYSQQFETVRQRLSDLGIRHIREGLMPGRPDQYESLDALASIGVHSTLIMGDPGIGGDGLAELIATLKSSARGSVEAVEGPNEYDTRGGSGWGPALASYQQQLYAAVKSDPSLAALPVIGPSIVQKRNQEALGDISSSLDFGNVHSYPMGEEPEDNVSSYLSRAALNSGTKPVMVTETGYHNALGWGGEQSPVSEAATATYMPRLFLEYFGRGITRTFAYELVDQRNDPNDREANWGLLRNDLSEKPAFTTMRNLISILQDPGPAIAAQPLDFTVTGNRADLHQVLLQKRDGSYYLALGRAERVFDAGSRTDLSPAPAPVALEFDRKVRSAERFLPGSSAAASGSVAAGANRVSLEVGAAVTIVRLELGAAAPTGRISASVSRRSVPAGGEVSVRGRLPSQSAGRSRTVNIERYLASSGSWQTIGRGRAAKDGRFTKTLRIPSRFGAVSRLRVSAGTAKPSKPLTLRVRGSQPEPALAAAEALG